MPAHIGIVACSAEGALQCYQTIRVWKARCCWIWLVDREVYPQALALATCNVQAVRLHDADRDHVGLAASRQWLLGAPGLIKGPAARASATARTLTPLEPQALLPTSGGRVGKVLITWPCCTLHGGGLRVTVSTAFHMPNENGQRELHAICGDIRWPRS